MPDQSRHRSRGRGPRWIAPGGLTTTATKTTAAAAAILALGLWLQAPPVRADSLLDLFRSDPLADLGAPEARPRARRGQVIYPAPGLPTLLRPGGEIVARVRVRRALTPPPGVQQRHFLLYWEARLRARVPLAAPGTEGAIELPLSVIQIRPEDEGFVYRVRLGVPAHAPEGVYDLVVDGPGLFDVAHRSVRVLPAEGADLSLMVVASGADLWDEAEALWLLDPAAVLVPGGLLEASIPLDRWPLATFAVPSSSESEALFCLSLPPEMVSAAAAAAGCPVEGPEAARCLVEALGGAAALNRCGDELVRYHRRAGPAVYASGIGAVTLVGVRTSDVPEEARTSALVDLAGVEVEVRPEPGLSRARLSLEQRRWLEHWARFAPELLVLADRRPFAGADPAGRWLAERIEGGTAAVVEAGTGPAEVRLRWSPRPPREGPEQVWGLDPGTYRIAGVRRRPRLAPPGVVVRRAGEGLVVDIRRAPAAGARLRVLVPARPGGWRVAAEGRRARLAGAGPASGDLCATEQVVLEVALEPGPRGPARVRVLPAAAEGAAPRVEIVAPARGPVIGRPVELSARTSGLDEPAVFWELGDGAQPRGAEVGHRYIRSGPHRVCVAAVDGRGRVASAGLRLHVLVRRGGGRGRAAAAAAGLIGLALGAMLLGLLKGNIVPRG